MSLVSALRSLLGCDHEVWLARSPVEPDVKYCPRCGTVRTSGEDGFDELGVDHEVATWPSDRYYVHAAIDAVEEARDG